MKHVLAFLGILALGLLLLTIAAPARGQSVVTRIVHFIDPVPPLPEPEAPLRTAGTTAIGGAPPEVPVWRREEMAADRAFAAGEFLAAWRAYADAAPKAPPADGMRLRTRADHASLFRLLAEDITPDPGPDRPGDEADYRRRLDALKPTAGSGAWLELAEFARSRGLDSHLAYLYERAFGRRDANPGVDEVQAKVTKIVKKLVAERKAENAPPPKEVLESLIRELPTSEAAEIARRETGVLGGGGPGFAGVERRGDAPVPSPGEAGRVAEAARLFRLGDAEYRQAIPGSRDVNKHRRAALDAFTKARTLYEESDRATASDAHAGEIHDCNRNIAELRKDLPVGK